MSGAPIDIELSLGLWHIQKLPLFSLLALLAYTIYGAIYRLYLCPIAHIPGPWFAKLTFWNEFYYDVVLEGKYTWKIREYYQKYGLSNRLDG